MRKRDHDRIVRQIRKEYKKTIDGLTNQISGLCDEVEALRVDLGDLRKEYKRLQEENRDLLDDLTAVESIIEYGG